MMSALSKLTRCSSAEWCFASHCSNAACTSATKTTVFGVFSGKAGFFSSIAIGSDGLGLISFEVQSRFGVSYLDVAHCSDARCTSATTTPLDTNVGQGTSIVIGSFGSRST